MGRGFMPGVSVSEAKKTLISSAPSTTKSHDPCSQLSNQSSTIWRMSVDGTFQPGKDRARAMFLYASSIRVVDAACIQKTWR